MAKALVNSAGKVLLRNGKVATDDCPGTCCGAVSPCGAPTGDCVHYINFQFNLDAAEVDFGGSAGYILLFSNYGIFPDYDGSQWWVDTADSQVLTIPFASTAAVALADTWHDAQFVFVSDGVDLTFHFCIDGISSDESVTDGSLIGDLVTDLTAGSRSPFNSISHRSIRDITIFSNDPADIDSGFFTVFAFPPGEFDDTSGTGVTFPETGTLRIDNDDTTGPGAFATKDADPLEEVWNQPVGLICCCDLDPFSEISSIKVDFTLTKDSGACDDLIPPCFTAAFSLSKTWTRVAADATPGENEFKIYCKPGTFIETAPGIYTPTNPRRADFLAGYNVTAGGGGTGTTAGLFMSGLTQAFMTCCNPLSHDVAPGPAGFVQSIVLFGAQKESSPFNYEQSDCGFFGLQPSVPTAGFYCVDNDDSSKNCSVITGSSVSSGNPMENVAFEDLTGIHTWAETITDPFVHTWTATWAVTVS